MFVETLFQLQIANVAYFQRKIQLSGFSAYPGGFPSQLTRLSLCVIFFSASFVRDIFSSDKCLCAPNSIKRL